MTTGRMRPAGRPAELRFAGGGIRLPAFLPDATRAVLKGLDAEDLRNCGIAGVVVNTFHLMAEPGATVIAGAGGVKKFMGWDGLAVSDSGGFQLLSMLYRDKSAGTVTDEGVIFHRSQGGKRRKYSLTPESSIRVQFALGADIMFCLDDCPPPGAKREKVEACARRTVEWAKCSKEEFEKEAAARGGTRPLLFAVIQGGNDRKLREECAAALVRTGFDGFGFGGWPLDESGEVDAELLGFVAGLCPADKPRFALGVGSPRALVEGTKRGYDIFDCSLPSRDARHKRLYVFESDPPDPERVATLNIGAEKFTRDTRPIGERCDCLACRRYSRAYLHHLFEVEDPLAMRLSTIHNLCTWAVMIETLQKGAK